MYGLVNRAVEDLVRREFGDEKWQQILGRAGIDNHEFVGMDQYPDELTYQLVGAASEVLETPVDALLEAFGRSWVRYTAREGYGELLDLSGRTFEEFVANLDAMHTRVGLTFPDLKPPSFRLDAVNDGSYRLSYYSDRPGLAPMVVGLLHGVADKFGVEVEVGHETGEDCEVFVVRVFEKSHGR